MKYLLILFSIFFVLFSFAPSLYEILTQEELSAERAFVLEHNYMFDYNFYLSRIRQGQEGRWLVVEKYYNKPHSGSLIQSFYLYAGKIGGIFGASPTTVYHGARLVLGFVLLILIARYTIFLFKNWWQAVAFLFIITLGSWPILVEVESGYRFATYMGWWSTIDSLQRITFLPHVLVGQMFILIFIWKFGKESLISVTNSLLWGIIGFFVGIIFPPALIVIYAVFFVLSVLEVMLLRYRNDKTYIRDWTYKILNRVIFILLSLPALVYLQFMFRILPWRALAEFDIQHRIILPYLEYALALGPILPLGLVGLLLVLLKKEKKFIPLVSWVIAIGLLFVIFENISQQSPSRFTEAVVHIPLGLLATYLFYSLWQKNLITKIGLKRHIRLIRILIGFTITTTIIIGVLVMLSMVGWLTDQVKGKRAGTWAVPIGAELAYPLDDFMEAIYFLRDNTEQKEIVLGYVTAGNFIPAYAGNYVYLGHANTPDEDGKEKIAKRFFSGKMSSQEAREFLTKEEISYIYFGPQERELGGIQDIMSIYPIIYKVYSNAQVNIYKIP